ncbi:transcription factor [Aspergillus saccharolyticus JOP 1030-1]|uniref:Fungal-specific transcription factor n=1 Tax=Aspergillus saccharolyticus JOP 1030-1 TaxID=1450539 RepID=A0A318Z4P3_9EURO|nr:fungal-specific transcription factor [Aspergillus saccharolyticus JOP 1030-1]PYH41414.1 fungal-specific transcription factor [Aspergillus saccharolyticus JOP 1030-1]
MAGKTSYRIASIPGDGIGLEVVKATIKVVTKLAQTLGTFDIDFDHIPWGTDYYQQTGRYASEDALEILRKFDAGLFGSVGHPDVPDHVSLWGLLLAIRGPLQLYANVRPVRTFPGTRSPLATATEGIDWMLVRENSEGEYCGQGGISHINQPWETATEVAIFTRVGIERIMRFAFETARSRPRRHLTVVTKSNAMRYGMVLWDKIAEEVSKDFPDVPWDKMLVDAMTIRMVNKPESLDTIVGTNLHMDILSDLAASLAGSIGVAPSANLDPTRKNPSIFEPVHGSAFDIMGKGIANPVATFWSAAEMLQWLGEKEAAKKLMDCVEKVCAAGILTADLGGTATTQDVVDAVKKEIEQFIHFSDIFFTGYSQLAGEGHHAPVKMRSPVPASGPSEIGSLTAHSQEESEFVGSSSGVYFVKTVRRAFSQSLGPLDAASSSQGFPPPEDTLVGSEELPSARRSASVPTATSPLARATGHALRHWKYDSTVAAILGEFPPLGTARELMMMYFKVWHPLFPFLHGPSFLQAMEGLCSEGPESTVEALPSEEQRHACWTIIFQCVFNLAGLLSPQANLLPESRIESPSKIHTLLGTLSCRHDLLSVQALLACQLYLVAKMSLRAASTVGGCVLRSILHAGLHRCPFRYKELTSHDRQLRKRIFWSAYAIDRYLSQTLGLPLGIQDSDIDVCPPLATEIHIPGSYERINAIRRAISPISPGSSPISPEEDRSLQPNKSAYGQQPPAASHLPPRDFVENHEQHRRELVFASYVESGKLTGRALELFHKSILVRSVPHSAVLYLITDVHKWWNSLSIETLQHGGHNQQQQQQAASAREDASTSAATAATDPNSPFNFAPFFTVLYQHLILLINRPSLSLHPSSPEFCSGLQTCIGAAREILAALTIQQESGQAFFWPGFLSAAWMSGLVLAFACQLQQYVLAKGSREIFRCLSILESMARQWETAKQCHRSLTLLSRHIHHHHQTTSTSTILQRPGTANDTPRTRKRKLDDHDHDQDHLQQQQQQQHASDRPIPSSGFGHRRSSRLPPTAVLSHLVAEDSLAYGHKNNNNNNHNQSDVTGSAEPLLDAGLLGNQQHLHHERSRDGGYGDPEDRGQFSGFMAMDGVDADMIDLLQGSNFDDLADMFGQQFPTF